MSEVPGTVRLIAERYRLLSLLGEDGGGVLWLARDEVLTRDVAIKEVRAPQTLGPGDTRRLYEHLENAARAAGRVSHRNVVAVHDVVTEDGRPWIVRELVRGLTLADVLEAEGPLPPRRAAHIGAEVLAALRVAHAAGVLHRDVKPSSVLIANDGRVMVTDFGTLTARDSPEFGAPETVAGRDPGPDSDLWSLGALLHAATQGRSAFGANRDPAVHPSRGGADALETVVTGLLHRNPSDRMDVAEAEHLLRLASSGGAARTDVPVTASPSTDSRFTGPAHAREPESASARAGTVVAETPGPTDDSRRATTVLAVGVALLLLFLVALVWALAGTA
ncbi:serine/threonine-protein kinase [Streptomyces sp. NPDC096176]|uniref:serine/threonine-protein kinase n=1 Tax=Streptomyces sp. NPDC096176 TaxID=3366079 RepID=UPI0038067EBA